MTANDTEKKLSKKKGGLIIKLRYMYAVKLENRTVNNYVVLIMRWS